MRILLDTHVWLWWLSEPERLPERVASELRRSRNELFLSVASSWEIAIKHALGKLPLPEAPAEFVPKRLLRDGIKTLHIEHRHALHVATLPPAHQDPFDRLLIAQAQLEQMPIATVDGKFGRYEVALL
ncbi:MAG: type II toxin-antitoxin system VapC family toxin [Verrucomicrobiales bacterium]|nr:type II toxin-antitoxin system VapC family toxin [Verrucomicrobiales bacterium]